MNLILTHQSSLGLFLFDKLNLPVFKKTKKTGYSTSADVLEKLIDHHEIVPKKSCIIASLEKLYSTYIEGLLKVVHSDSSKNSYTLSAGANPNRTLKLDGAEPAKHSDSA
ncbi:hypothetical protein GCM10020331_032610 [Ectobacillus funiculus]